MERLDQVKSKGLDDNRDEIVRIATKALLYEVTVLPKPGLVDPLSSGPHPDMNVFNFIDSAISLESYFAQAFTAGWNYTARDFSELFTKVRAYGITAEHTMLLATKGINTHKGAIFSLGILVTATGYVLSCGNLNLDKIVEVEKKMVHGLVKKDFAKIQFKPVNELTAGEQQYLKYGESGIRGEAEDGYPTVMNVALPFLRQSKGTHNQRLLDTFMIIVSCSNDSNLIKRAGTNTIVKRVHEQADEYLLLGGSCKKEGRAKLAELNEFFLKKNLSLGGSADLLILTIYFGLLEGIL
ncbi:triphosphoribosyl-dephospho-CoA synthase CitG [Liquorilactobacillus oeni]|uniref:Probable 2-(5''-triphosphoribosyl)-3'-dephosphocoenzyme-A synthase n=1 Tax=Liquorilactobacillus oeni DSM 19972 TaxID=1423777 RepID=A0A0R1MBT6_9LACO|nr:triphosphoribosyl-dephospho-CoA synthase CitG [Liquorilactobacillus oeni]KRL05361.1 citG protein [Liquorilactobacillus oeni DSM 19972]